MDAFPISGRTFAVRQPFFFSRETPGRMLPSDEENQPLLGDVRLSGVVDEEARRGCNGATCRGTLTAAVFDGVCWRRLDLTGLTRMNRFQNPVQLYALQRWVNGIVKGAAERTCVSLVDEELMFVGYSVLPDGRTAARERSFDAFADDNGY